MWHRRGSRPAVASAVNSTVRKNVLGGPAPEIKVRPVGQERKAGGSELLPPLPGEQNIELLLQRVQMQHVGRRVGDLSIGQRGGTPVGQLLLLRYLDAEHVAHQVLETVPVGIGAG